MARGRPRSPSPPPESYSSELYEKFLSRVDDNSSELAGIQADRQEILKAEAQRGLNRKAHAFVQSLRTAVRNDKLTVQDALATLDCVDVYADWSGLTAQRDLFRPKSKDDQPPPKPRGANGTNGAEKPKRGGGKPKGPSVDVAMAAAQAHLGTA